MLTTLGTCSGTSHGTSVHSLMDIVSIISHHFHTGYLTLHTVQTVCVGCVVLITVCGYAGLL
jgi:hypothetical protein